MEIPVWNLDYYNSRVRYQPETRIVRNTIDPKYIDAGEYRPHCFPILPLEDNTPDGGFNLTRATLFSGRRVVPESVPWKLSWHSKLSSPDDFQWTTVYSVSDRLHNLIEELEPKVHQFERLEIIGRHQRLIERRWFWQICNRINSVVSSDPDLEQDNYGNWIKIPQPKILSFDIEKTRKFHFWREAYLHGPVLLCSNTAKLRMEKTAMTGALFKRMGVARNI